MLYDIALANNIVLLNIKVNMKLTVIQSPINQITDQNILQRYHPDPNTNKDDIQMIRKRLSSNIAKIAQHQTSIVKQRISQFKQLKNNILNVDKVSEQNKVNLVSDSYQRNQDMSFGNQNFNINIARKLTFGTQQKYNLSAQRKKKLNDFLQQIKEFKESIKSIRQKFTHKSMHKNIKQVSSSKKSQRELKCQKQKYSYTSYKDLSSHKAHRWRSNDKSYSYIKTRPQIEQFTIDASD